MYWMTEMIVILICVTCTGVHCLLWWHHLDVLVNLFVRIWWYYYGQSLFWCPKGHVQLHTHNISTLYFIFTLVMSVPFCIFDCTRTLWLTTVLVLVHLSHFCSLCFCVVWIGSQFLLRSNMMSATRSIVSLIVICYGTPYSYLTLILKYELLRLLFIIMLCLNALLLQFAHPSLYISFKFMVIFFQGGSVLRDMYHINWLHYVDNVVLV